MTDSTYFVKSTTLRAFTESFEHFADNNVTRHAKRDHLGSYVITSEKTFETSRLLMSFS